MKRCFDRGHLFGAIIESKDFFTMGVNVFGYNHLNFIFLRELKARGKNFKVRVQTLISSRERAEAAVNFAADMAADEVQLMRMDLHAFAGR